MKTIQMYRNSVCIMLLTPLLFLGAGMGVRCVAQNVGISSTGATPDNSAMLDVLSTTKGMLIPRMTGTEKYAITTPATGLLIFQTDTVGFWYHDGSKWIPLVSSTSSTASPSNAGWLTTGNIGTAWDKNFLGTTDNVSLRLRTNNVERMIVDSIGNVGINIDSIYTISPHKLRVNGFFNATSIEMNGGGSYIGFNTYWNSSASRWEYRKTGRGAIIRLAGTDGADRIQFFTVDSNNTVQNAAVTNRTERLTILNNGNVGIGTASPAGKFHVSNDVTGNDSSVIISNKGWIGVGQTPTASISAQDTIDYLPEVILESIRSANNNAGYFLSRRANGTRASKTTVNDNDNLGTLMFQGYDGASYINSAWIQANVDGAVSAGKVPGRISFLTMDAGGVTTTRMMIKNNGNVGIGTTSPTAKLDISSSTGYNQLRMQTSYTPANSADTNGNTGDIAWDSNYIYIKTSGGWKRAALSSW